MRGSVKPHGRLIIFQTGCDSRPRNMSLVNIEGLTGIDRTQACDHNWAHGVFPRWLELAFYKVDEPGGGSHMPVGREMQVGMEIVVKGLKTLVTSGWKVGHEHTLEELGITPEMEELLKKVKP